MTTRPRIPRPIDMDQLFWVLIYVCIAFTLIAAAVTIAGGAVGYPKGNGAIILVQGEPEMDRCRYCH